VESAPVKHAKRATKTVVMMDRALNITVKAKRVRKKW